jgi:hypothetical protein
MKKLYTNHKIPFKYQSDRYTIEDDRTFIFSSKAKGYVSVDRYSLARKDFVNDITQWSKFNVYLFEENEIVDIDNILCKAVRFKDHRGYSPVLILEPL